MSAIPEQKVCYHSSDQGEPKAEQGKEREPVELRPRHG